MQNELMFGINLNWQQVFETCDNLIRAGHFQQVVAMFNGLKAKKIPRPQAQRVAHFYYRIGMFTQGLQVLAPIVYPKKSFGREPASELEIATYAILLIKIGSVQEAQKLLASLSERTPEAFLYRAFADQAEWNYESAISHLRRYLSFPELSDYEIAIAQVNLAADLIDAGETQEAKPLLVDLTEKSRIQGWKLVQKNCRELRGQLAVALKDLTAADQALKEAVALDPSRDSGIFDFFVDKWRAIVSLQQNPQSVQAQNDLRAIRARAQELQHWESVRECDRCLALVLKDPELFRQVFFGTRFPAYRQKLMREAGEWARLPSTHIRGSAQGVVFDLVTAQSDDGRIKLKTGTTLHRMLLALAADSYRPLYVGQLFAFAYPQECFIAEFSEGRVAAAVSRLRKWAETNGLPLHFEVKDQFYRMIIDESRGPFGLRYTLDVQARDLEGVMESHFVRLKGKLNVAEFSSKQVVEALEISKSSAVRLLGWALKHGKLDASGNNKATKYRFTT